MMLEDKSMATSPAVASWKMRFGGLLFLLPLTVGPYALPCIGIDSNFSIYTQGSSTLIEEVPGHSELL